MDRIVYTISDNIYINLTNRCSNSCEFCIRTYRDGIEDYNLWLTSEPTAAEVIEALGDVTAYSEVVFCGFGEPTYRMDEIVEIGRYVRSKGVRVRLNTNGQGYLISGEDAATRLVGAVDVVSISLNACDTEKYQDVCHSIYPDAYENILRYAKDCRALGLEVVMSVMSDIGMYEINECVEIAREIGATLRVREMA